MVMSIPPKVSIATVVGRIKGRTAHALNLQFGSFGWQSEYGIVSFAERHLADVVAYVQDQPRRHATDRLWSNLEQLQAPDDRRRDSG
jgi:putative transposase